VLISSSAVAILADADGEVAQLAEHATENRGVGSSILPLATTLMFRIQTKGGRRSARL
jgi:hypothetical protein